MTANVNMYFGIENQTENAVAEEANSTDAPLALQQSILSLRVKHVPVHVFLQICLCVQCVLEPCIKSHGRGKCHQLA